MKILVTMILLCLPVIAEAKTEITFWHAMSGDLGTALNQLVDQFNSSQSDYHVTPVFKGTYTETLNAAVAAYRCGQQPDIAQIFEVGTMSMMSSGAIVPVGQLLADNNGKVDWNDFIPPIRSYYADKDGKLLSMPFNSSTPIMYYNKDLLKKAGIKAPPKTWQELYADSQQAVKGGAECGLVVGWQSWILLENFSAIQNLPFAELDDGYSGLAKKLTFNSPEAVKNIETLQGLTASKAFAYEGRGSDPAQIAFSAGRCAFYMDSSGQIGIMQAANKFAWGAAPLPYNQGVKPKNSIIGGATLWVFKDKKPEDYKAIAAFIGFLAKTDSQVFWHKATGYLPVTKAAYNKLKKEGYYKKFPEQEVAIAQLTRGTPGVNSRGIRLGGFTAIREIIEEEMENIWAKKKSAAEGLKSAVDRGNRVLESFARTAGTAP